MKKHISLLAAVSLAALAFSTSANAAPAKSVRVAQERLTQLGFFSGPLDGEVGAITKNALMNYQSMRGLPVTGALTTETAQMLRADTSRAWPYYAYNNPYYGTPNGYTSNGYAYMPSAYNNVPVVPQNTVRAIPVNYGSMTVNESTNNGLHNYVVSYNGYTLLQANNQPQPLRVAKTNAQMGEDAVVFTAEDANSTCHYRNYLVTVRSDGSATQPQEVGNCGGIYTNGVAYNAPYNNYHTAWEDRGTLQHL